MDMFGSIFMVDFNGVTAEQPYYIFQKVSDGIEEAISDSFEVVYHNTPPDNPKTPLGETDVSCVNDNEEYEGQDIIDCDTWQVHTRSWAVNTSDWPPAVGWTQFEGTSWTVNWSSYDEGVYYMFQRANDGFGHVYSNSLMITVGPPTLPKPPTPSGPTTIVCDDPITEYDAGVYMLSCPGVEVTREWAFNTVPTAPAAGWTEFEGTTFDVDPITLGIGNRYIYQRAVLGPQIVNSDPLLVVVQPGWLGNPPMPSGLDEIDCTSTEETYDMGLLDFACPGTPITRSWQIRDSEGEPITTWAIFIGTTIEIDWTIYESQESFQLIQKADDGLHVTYSDPLIVDFINDEPVFLSGLSGPELVDCKDMSAYYDGGEVDDCDPNQTLVREWAWNTVDEVPLTGWTEMLGTGFTIDFGSSEFAPGDVYFFQRVSDGMVTIYDPVSLYVDYENTAPDEPSAPEGVTYISCTNLIQDYDVGIAYDCDNTPLVREWALNDADTPPATNWFPITGTSFQMNWTGAAPGFYYLFQRVSDDEETVYSISLEVEVVNTPPDIGMMTATEGSGPFRTDGETIGLSGLDFVNELNITAEIDDCDGDEWELYYVISTSPIIPDQGDPSWIGPTTSNQFTVDLTAIAAAEAPNTAYIFVGVDDGYNWETKLFSGIVNLYKKVSLIDFADSGDMWIENACFPGTGSYNWSYDSGNGFLRLTGYGEDSQSAVWSDPVTFPSAPGAGKDAVLMSYLNPGLATGFDNVQFGFLRESGCDQDQLDIITGNGCSSENPSMMEFAVPKVLGIWGDDALVGIYHNGLDGCGSSNFYVDWVGVWTKPM